MTTTWLMSHLLDLASAVDRSGQTIYRFRERVEERFFQRPLQEWEVDRWFRGLRHGLIRAHANFVRIGARKDAPLSLFVRNTEGKYVGLRREAVTQAATYVSLITDYGYGRDLTRFESAWMDVVVRGRDGVLIYAENKAGESTLRRLMGRLTVDFENGIPRPTDEEALRLDDPTMKARHIWKNRPRFFWGVSPQIQEAYDVLYNARGFKLSRRERLPSVESDR